MRINRNLTVGLISAAGSGNYGDELIRKLWLDFYDKANVVDVCFQRSKDLDKANYEFVSLEDFWLGNFDFSKLDFIHFLGGGYINDEFETISKYTDVISKLGNIPLIASGISVQPSSTEHLEDFFSHNWKLMGLRDSESCLSARKNLGVRASWSYDDTWKFSLRESLMRNHQKQTRLFLNLQQQFTLSNSADYEVISDSLIDLIYALKKSIPNLIIVVIEADKSDAKLSLDLSRYFANVEIINAEEWLNSAIQFSPSDMLVSSRFHPRLLFSRAGIKVKHISLGDYYKLKHDDSTKKIFFQSDDCLKDSFGLKPKGARFYLWRLGCLYRARLFKFRICCFILSIKCTKVLKKHLFGK